MEKRGSFVLIAAALVALGLVIGGYLLGDGLRRAKAADRSVTVRGLAERNVTADLAVWTLNYSRSGEDLAAVRAQIDGDTGAIRRFFATIGFPADALRPAGASVMQSYDNGVQRFTVTQRLQLRTGDVARAEGGGATVRPRPRRRGASGGVGPHLQLYQIE